MGKKRVLVYPCGTEIGLEIYRAVCNSIHFELIGGSSSYDHGRFVFKNHIDGLPFITDESGPDEIEAFQHQIEEYGIDYIYPAMDGVLYKFAEYKDLLGCGIIAPDFSTARITRSKKLTYETLKGLVPVPKLFDIHENLTFPLFMKPDVGQGSAGANKICSKEDLDYFLNKSGSKKMLLMEYLPGEEYTVDCFTNRKQELVYAGCRGRNRIKGGISVNAVAQDDEIVLDMAQTINSRLKQKGGWFFQVKRNERGDYTLMEVASRIAGASSFTRNLGVNLPLLTLHLFSGNDIGSVICNRYCLELDRALQNTFKTDIRYSRVYVDYDDTLLVDNKLNIQLVAFLYQCVNNHIPITLLSKHTSNLEEELKERRIRDLFDSIQVLDREEQKYLYIKEKDSIFIDDSYGERAEVYNKLKINVFDTHMIECLINE